MSEPKRYNPSSHYSADFGMAQSPAGKWVSYEDYARLKADLRNCHTAIRVKEEENARLKAEVERLKEGNEDFKIEHLDAWNAAKEGKQP